MLIQEEVSALDEFGWKCHLRCYLPDPDDGAVFVHMVTTELRYAFEYLGNTQRLVITPLTVRSVVKMSLYSL